LDYVPILYFSSGAGGGKSDGGEQRRSHRDESGRQQNEKGNASSETHFPESSNQPRGTDRAEARVRSPR